MKLISGQLPWENTLLQPPVYPVLNEDITCDCLIVGGGMGGATMSYRMSSAERIPFSSIKSSGQRKLPRQYGTAADRERQVADRLHEYLRGRERRAVL